MGKKATGGGEPRELIPARTYLGVIVGAYDIGTQEGYQGKGTVAKFILEFELHFRGTRKNPPRPTADSKGHPFTICKFVSFYLSRTKSGTSDLLKVVEAVEGRALTADEIKEGYDVEELLGKVVQVQVANEVPAGKTDLVAKVEAILPLDPDEEEPESGADTHYFEIREGDRTIPAFVPKFVAGWIEKSREFGGDVGTPAPAPANRQPVGAGVGAADDDSIPF